MSTFGELLRATPPTTEKWAPSIRPSNCAEKPTFRNDSIYDEQIRDLIQQLFLKREPRLVKSVGFAPADASTKTEPLCLETARALAAQGSDVALIDADPGALTLQQSLAIPDPTHSNAPFLISSRLWIVPRQCWWPDAGHSSLTERNLVQLREFLAEFDFSILRCAPASWLTSTIGQNCDGLVLVLTANKTRRLVAAQIKDRFIKAEVPLLGTVLVERSFPIPQGLYRSL
jgi:Mrp family chromosome partitioning ATPase